MVTIVALRLCGLLPQVDDPLRAESRHPRSLPAVGLCSHLFQAATERALKCSLRSPQDVEVAYRRRSAGPQESLERRWRACSVTMNFSVVDPQRMMCTYGPAEGFLLNHSYMHDVWVNINAIRCSLIVWHASLDGVLHL